MKLMTYNILDGGILPDPARLERVVEVIHATSSDVLALQEIALEDGKDNRLVQTLRESGYLYEARLTRENFHTYLNGTCLLSRKPPKDKGIVKEDIPAVFMTFPHAEGDLTVCTVYLSWEDEASRFAQVKEVLAMMEGKRYGIILGDFNALSSQDGLYDDLVPSFTDRMREKYCRDNRICYDTIDAVLDQGYVDVGLQFHHPAEITRMTDLHPGASHSMPVRIDYVFATQDILPFISSFECVDTATTRMASDHFPWTVTVDDAVKENT